MSNSKKISSILQKLGGGKALTKISTGMDKLIYDITSDLRKKLQNEFNITIYHEKKSHLKILLTN